MLQNIVSESIATELFTPVPASLIGYLSLMLVKEFGQLLIEIYPRCLRKLAEVCITKNEVVTPLYSTVKKNPRWDFKNR